MKYLQKPLVLTVLILLCYAAMTNAYALRGTFVDNYEKTNDEGFLPNDKDSRPKNESFLPNDKDFPKKDEDFLPKDESYNAQDFLYPNYEGPRLKISGSFPVSYEKLNDEGFGPEDEGFGSEDEGLGSEDEGLGPEDEVLGSEDEGFRFVLDPNCNGPLPRNFYRGNDTGFIEKEAFTYPPETLRESLR